MSDQPSKEDLLGRVPLFQGLDGKHLKSIARLMTSLEEPAGKVLRREGHFGGEFLIVQDGEVEVRHGDQLIATCGSGDYLGEIALLTKRPSVATLVAKTPVHLLVLSPQEFSTLLADEPAIAVKIVVTMAERLAALENRESS